MRMPIAIELDEPNDWAAQVGSNRIESSTQSTDARAIVVDPGAGERKTRHLDEMSRTISRNIERTTGAAKLIDNLECQRIVQMAWKQTADAFGEVSQDDVIAMAAAHRATKDMLASIRNAALANDKDRVERVVGFVLSAVDDRRTEQRETHRRVQEKRRAIQCKMEELQRLRSRNARNSHKARARVDEVGDRQNKRVKKSLHPTGKGASLARAKKQKIIDLDEDGLEAIPGLCNSEMIHTAMTVHLGNVAPTWQGIMPQCLLPGTCTPK
ncbi:hypothetical protein FOZ61_002093 [Perkinsus olseni]|uniref:Uncharacterized protein n=1 Tax=Perkinsus olseni TaxID=32597 RepID=A0A7J6LUE8_PEROL|nr:hypothetical protein FOZ61_002093 [Perkinsus olseni]KAF4666047.1 hypothetical protein FOL46_003296 [Perkinsus olseni]